MVWDGDRRAVSHAGHIQGGHRLQWGGGGGGKHSNLGAAMPCNQSITGALATAHVIRVDAGQGPPPLLCHTHEHHHHHTPPLASALGTPHPEVAPGHEPD